MPENIILSPFGLHEVLEQSMGKLVFHPSLHERHASYNLVTGVALGFGIAFVGGTLAAVAVGGVLVLRERGLIRLPWDKKDSRRYRPLSAEEWHAAFDENHGRLKGGGEKIIGRVRLAGCDVEIRHLVWPFLLGLFGVNSTESDREARRAERRAKFERLCDTARRVGERGKEEEERREEEERQREAEITKKRKDQEDEEDGTRDRQTDEQERSSITEDLDDSFLALASSSESFVDVAESHVDAENLDRSVAGEDLVEIMRSEKQTTKTVEICNDAEDDSSSIQQPTSDLPDLLDLPEVFRQGTKGLENFETWRRIMRLDAVRMNAAWIPYSTQKEFPESEAEEAVDAVGIRDHVHLTAAQRLHAARLVRILEAYAIHDHEIGYCQGMSDLLSPFVALMDDDADAFWCFEAFMRKARQNFRVDEIGIRKQLEIVAKILRVTDPEVYAHLKKMGAEDCIFVYRMLVVLLRRELSFEQTISLWEVIWADEIASAAYDSGVGSASSVGGEVGPPIVVTSLPSNDLLLFVIAAIISSNRREILGFQEMDEVLRFCNSLAGNLDVWDLLQYARELVGKFHKL